MLDCNNSGVITVFLGGEFVLVYFASGQWLTGLHDRSFNDCSRRYMSIGYTGRSRFCLFLGLLYSATLVVISTLAYCRDIVA